MRSSGLFCRAAAGLAAALMLVPLTSCSTVRKMLSALKNGVTDGENGYVEVDVHDPAYIYTIEKGALEESGLRNYTMSVYDPESDNYDDSLGQLLQEFQYKAIDSEDAFHLDDVNFDGKTDLIIQTSRGAGAGGNFEVYLWHDNYSIYGGSTGFLPTPALVYEGTELTVTKELKQFYVTDRPASTQTTRTLWQVGGLNGYDNDMIRELRREYFTVNEETGKNECEVYQLIEGEWTVIYKTDDPEKNALIADNYFQYGAADPISFERALEIADFRFGEGDDTMKGLRTFGRTTYYYICRKDENEDYGVSTDGKEIITIQPGRTW